MKYEDISAKDAINVFKQRLKNNQMNLLVGAGVSMCASSLFKSWRGLLQDMVAFLYPDELKSHGVTVVKEKKYYCHYLIIGEKKDEIINKIIDREGILNIPSKYIQRTGMRESLEAYIESHTPIIHTDKKTIELFDKIENIDFVRDLGFIRSMLSADFNGKFTTNYDHLLETVGDSLNVCVKAADLSLRGLSDYIIKLHGNITNDSSCFGFDQDNFRRYVLTKEDYDDYPLIHEAFMQLMRISLLKDCFCLVGFSGTDYNFISWIKWVRDILAENRRNNKIEAKNIKIFFIDCFDRPLDEATKQFFENYSIYRIVLPNNDVKKEIGVEVVNEDSNAHRRLLMEKFFDYVKELDEKEYGDTGEDGLDKTGKNENDTKQNEPFINNDDVTIPTIKEIKSKKRQNLNLYKEIQAYNTSWADVYTLKGTRYNELEVNEKKANLFIAEKEFFRYSLGIHYQELYLESISQKENVSEIESRLALLAMEQMMVVVDEEGEKILKKIEPALKTENEILRIRKLRLRARTMEDPTEDLTDSSNDLEIYEKCLRYAFTFQYGKLKDTLSKWNPSSAFLSKRALFMTLTDTKTAEGLITQSIIDNLPVQADRLRMSQLGNCISAIFPQKFSIRKFESISKQGMLYLNDWFFNKSIQKKEKVMPYGSGDYETGNIEMKNAERSLIYMIEFPIFVQIRIRSVIEGSRWYAVANTLYEKFPYPILFYSTTLNDRNILRRIGQDYAFSNNLHDKLPGIAKRMFEMLVDENAPNTYWSIQNTCELLSEIIKAVPVEMWQHYIFQLWSNQYSPNIEKSRTNEGLTHLINTAFTMCNDIKMIEDIVVDCLNLSKDKHLQDVVQNIFYYLRVERFKGKDLPKLNEALYDFIKQINNDQDYALLANLNAILSEEQNKAITKTIPDIIKGNGIHSTYINGLVYFAKSDSKAFSVVKNAIISNTNLWKSGIHGNIVAWTEYLHIVELDEILNWSDQELKILFSKLKESADEILSHPVEREMFGFGHDELVNDMLRFLNIHKEALKKEDGYEHVFKGLKKRQVELFKTTSITESLYSEEETILNFGLNEIKDRLKSSGLRNNIHYVSMLLDRLLYKNIVGLQTVLNYMQYFVRDFVTSEYISRLPQLTMLLEKYDLNVLREMKQNVIVCSEYLILIAKALSNKGINNNGVQKWLCIKESNIFNWVICDTLE